MRGSGVEAELHVGEVRLHQLNEPPEFGGGGRDRVDEDHIVRAVVLDEVPQLALHRVERPRPGALRREPVVLDGAVEAGERAAPAQLQVDRAKIPAGREVLRGQRVQRADIDGVLPRPGVFPQRFRAHSGQALGFGHRHRRRRPVDLRVGVEAGQRRIIPEVERLAVENLLGRPAAASQFVHERDQGSLPLTAHDVVEKPAVEEFLRSHGGMRPAAHRDPLRRPAQLGDVERLVTRVRHEADRHQVSAGRCQHVGQPLIDQPGIQQLDLVAGPQQAGRQQRRGQRSGPHREADPFGLRDEHQRHLHDSPWAGGAN